jgi:hypothetical protein
LVPNPEEDHCHALINGDATNETAIAVLVNAIAELAYPAVGRAAGLEILVPKPEDDHGYTEMYGLLNILKATKDVLKSIALPWIDSAASANLVPKPVPETQGNISTTEDGLLQWPTSVPVFDTATPLV